MDTWNRLERLFQGNKSAQALQYETQLNSEATSFTEWLQEGTHLLPIIELLLERDSSVCCWRDANGLTPLLRAATLEAPYNVEVVKVIIRHHPQSAEVYDLSGKTILHFFSRLPNYQESKELLRLLPEIDYLVNYQDLNGNTAAHLAINNNNFYLLRALFDLSADLSIVHRLPLLYIFVSLPAV
ncbi:Inversin-B [Bienertia sinuspersici]